MSPHSWTSPLSHGNHRASSQAPCAYNNFPLTVVLHTAVYISALLPEFLPPSPSPYCVQPFFSISVSLLLPSCKSVPQCHSSRFHMCVLMYNICFLFLTSLCLRGSRLTCLTRTEYAVALSTSTVLRSHHHHPSPELWHPHSLKLCTH